MSGGQLLIIAIAVAMLVAVVVLTAIQLRGRRFRWLGVFCGAIFYLVVGNVVSRLLVGVIYPADPGSTGFGIGVLLVLQIIHSAVSLGTALVATIFGVAVLRRLLPRVGASRSEPVVAS